MKVFLNFNKCKKKQKVNKFFELKHKLAHIFFSKYITGKQASLKSF